MALADERLTERLPEIPSDVLAAILLRLAQRDTDLRRELIALTIDSKELVANVKHAISVLRSSKAYYRRVYAATVVHRLDELVAQIQKVSETSPKHAFELLCSLIATEGHVLQYVDDSAGWVGHAYRVTMPKAAARIAHRYLDEEHMTKSLRVALKSDPFGSRCHLIDALATIVPEAVFERLYGHVMVWVDASPVIDVYDSNEHSYVQRRILVALGDTERFIADCTHGGEMYEGDILTLTQMFIDHEDFKQAERWLKKVNAHQPVLHEAVQKLYLVINKALGRTTDVKAALKNAFLADANVTTYNEAAQHLNAKELSALKNTLVEQLIASSNASLTAILYLIENGKGAEMERVVAAYKPAQHIDYYAWYAIAAAFEHIPLPFGASLTFRLLINDILDNGRATAYGHAASYYEKLWNWSEYITDWRGLSDHDSFVADISESHPLKSSFWYEAEGQPKPPAVSRFKR